VKGAVKEEAVRWETGESRDRGREGGREGGRKEEGEGRKLNVSQCVCEDDDAKRSGKE